MADKWGKWRATAANAANVDQVAVTGKSHYVTGIQASGDAAALITIESPAATPIWRIRLTAAGAVSHVFDPPLAGAAGQAVRLAISAGTNRELNMQGYTGRETIV
jgi:hypothetical protein